MSALNVLVTSVIVAHSCGQCGVLFGLEDSFLADRQRDGRTFYCPNGHLRAYRVAAPGAGDVMTPPEPVALTRETLLQATWEGRRTGQLEGAVDAVLDAVDGHLAGLAATSPADESDYDVGVQAAFRRVRADVALWRKP